MGLPDDNNCFPFSENDENERGGDGGIERFNNKTVTRDALLSNYNLRATGHAIEDLPQLQCIYINSRVYFLQPYRSLR